MKRAALGFAVLFTLAGFSVPCTAQYWPNMREFKVPSNEDVQNARVKEAIKQGKYRAEIEALRKMAFGKSSVKAADLDKKIESSLKNTIKDIDAYTVKMQACAKEAVSDKSYCKNPYGLAAVYEDIKVFSSTSDDLKNYLFTVEQCGSAFKAQAGNVKKPVNCDYIISNKTFGYSKIMELSFKNDDRDNFFNAKKSLARHLKNGK